MIKESKKSILITGVAGFIGMNLAKLLLLNSKYNIIGIDNLNDYYDVNLKKERLKVLKKFEYFKFIKIDICNEKKINEVFKLYNFDYVVHLAAQAGVRYSLTNPKAYIKTNIHGFFNIIEASKNNKIKHFIYASSSSVYGLEKSIPFEETMKNDSPASLYAATKKNNENIAHTYSHLYGLPSTGLRFFTVYGPWGRPDMALFLFADAILKNKEIELYNSGNMYRDFTYIDDITKSINLLINKEPKSTKKNIPFRILNIGNSKKVKLINFLKEIEKNLEKKTKVIFKEIQPGDVKSTLSDSSRLYKIIGYKPQIEYKEGIKEFIEWFKKFYQ